MAKTPADAALVTRLQLGVLFRKDPRTIASWIESGMPVALKGRGGKAAKYAVPDCIEWRIQQELQARGVNVGALSPHNERALLDRKRREDLELKMRVRQGELVSAEDVAREYADLAISVKSRLRGIPDASADQLVAIARQGPAAVKGYLLARIDEALRDLARGAVIPPAAEAGEDDEPAAEESAPAGAPS